jgi:hypothetical protein
MVDLSKCTLPQLKKLALLLGWTTTQRTKLAIIQEIEAKKIPAEKITSFLTQIPKTTKKTSSKQKTLSAEKSESGSNQIIPRIEKIEQKLMEMGNTQAFLLKKINDIEVRISHVDPTAKNLHLPSIDSIKKILLVQISPGKTISTDNIRSMPQLKGYESPEIERAIIELIDQGKFDVSDGQAKWKIQDSIALLIRR